MGWGVPACGMTEQPSMTPDSAPNGPMPDSRTCLCQPSLGMRLPSETDVIWLGSSEHGGGERSHQYPCVDEGK